MVVGSANYHDSWLDDISGEERQAAGFSFGADNSRWENWVVQLQFDVLGGDSPGRGKKGNGFYVNIPNLRYDIILTAGHNLIDNSRQLTTNLKILQENITVDPKNVHICQKYKDDPDELSAIYDYGAILIERPANEKRRGFGFSLKHGLPGPLEGDVLVGGYRTQDMDGRPRRSSGKCIKCLDGQLEYEVETIAGISGAPVWTGYKGLETVVAIHNYGPEVPGAGNRGSRLNLNVFQDVFTWAGIGWEQKALKLWQESPTYEMHLSFQGEKDEGRVRVGKPGRVETRFDILPVYAQPLKPDNLAHYAFYFKKPPAWQAESESAWVLWDAENIDKPRVILTDKLSSKCEVRLKQEKRDTFKVIVPGVLRELSMRMDQLKEWDLELLENPEDWQETSEISFVKTGKIKYLFFFG